MFIMKKIFLYDKFGTILKGVKHKRIESVTIPIWVRSIGISAFQDCSSLTSVAIPRMVKSIGSSAFQGCSSLTSISFSKGLINIDESAFSGCSSLISIIIPNSVTRIMCSAFQNCSNLTSITISKYLISIESDTFSGCENLTSIKIPDNSINYIGDRAFRGCKSLATINIPDSATYIGNWAFENCICLTSINIPNSVTRIESGAFENCTGLTSINIPDSVTYIGDGAFYGCSGLTSVTLHCLNVGSWFNGMKSIKDVVLGDEVTTIYEYAFKNCSGLASVSIGNSVTSIGCDAFYGCFCLKSITRGNVKISISFGSMPSIRYLLALLKGEAWSDEYGVVFSVDKTKLIKAPKFLRKYNIPEGTIVICTGAFTDCYETLTYVKIPDSVRSIESNAFSRNDYLILKCMKRLDVPSTVESIGSRAFEGIKVVSYQGQAKQNSNRMWGAKMLIDGKPSYIGEIPWRGDAHNGCTAYYKGEIKNGVPNGYGGVYEVNMSMYGSDNLLYSGRWEDGVFLDQENPADLLTDEEWRHIN